MNLSSLDLRYEGFRLKAAALEERLLGSIAQRGIEEPLEGVEVKERSVLLNGFKRYRCARKLRLATVPYASLGPDEAVGILSLLRTSNNRALSILEQAGFIEELKHARQMSVAQIAAELSRSKSWVSMRLGLIAEMSAQVRRQLFAGAFPVYSYMYALRQFMRMNGVKPSADRGVCAGRQRQRFERAGGGATGPRLLPRDRSPFARKSSRATWPCRWSGCGKCPKAPTGATSLSGSCSETWN